MKIFKKMILLILCLGLFFVLSRETYGQNRKDETFYKLLNEEVEKKLDKLRHRHIVNFSKELLKKEEAIRLRELEFKKKREQLKMNITEFEKKLKVFLEGQKKFLSCIDSLKNEESKRVKHMVEVISNMRPKMAASVLSIQDTKISVKILGLLDPKKVSRIFNLMDKEVSARLQKHYVTMKI